MSILALFQYRCEQWCKVYGQLSAAGFGFYFGVVMGVYRQFLQTYRADIPLKRVPQRNKDLG
jgi:hypothetical protein